MGKRLAPRMGYAPVPNSRRGKKAASAAPGTPRAHRGWLPRPTSANLPLRIATLSFTVVDDVFWGLTSAAFLDALAASRAADPRECDLVLVSGRRLSSKPSAANVIASSCGAAVLFEVGDTDRGSWYLVVQSGGEIRTRLIRDRQLVETHKQHERMADLAKVLSKGGGVIDVEGYPAALALFICGENNALAVDGGRSVVKNTNGSALTAFKSDWILLNPSHRPYWPQVKSTGFGKVGKAGGMERALLQRLVDGPTFVDGTIAPIAAVHTNNFREDKQPTVAYSSRGFEGPRARVTDEMDARFSGAGWRYSAFLIAVEQSE